jgi:hypothetical protein
MAKQAELPFWLKFISFWVKVLGGAGIFWLFYHNYYQYPLDNWQSWLIVASRIWIYSFLATLLIRIVDFYLINLLYYAQYHKSTQFWVVHKFPSFTSIIYEFVNGLINIGLVMLGLTFWLIEITSTWYWFLIFYISMKIVSRLFARSLGKSIASQTDVAFGFLVLICIITIFFIVIIM